jgi:hypothetical protein
VLNGEKVWLLDKNQEELEYLMFKKERKQPEAKII